MPSQGGWVLPVLAVPCCAGADRIPAATLLVRWQVWQVGRKPPEMACWWAKALTQSGYCWKVLLRVTQVTVHQEIPLGVAQGQLPPLCSLAACLHRAGPESSAGHLHLHFERPQDLLSHGSRAVLPFPR